MKSLLDHVIRRSSLINVSDSPTNCELWSYRSSGLCSVGQDEVVLLLSRAQEESCKPSKDVFEHYQILYEQARAGDLII